MDLDGEGDLKFNELELNKLDMDGVEIIIFEGDRELNGKSSKSSGSNSGKSRWNLDVNGAHFFDGDRELKGKSSGSKSSKSRQILDVNGAQIFDSDRELKGKSNKGSKSRRFLGLDGKGNLEFDELELNELDLDGVKIIVFEGYCELNGKSGKSSGSKSGKSRQNLDVNGAHVFLMAIVSLKASPAREARAGGLWR